MKLTHKSGRLAKTEALVLLVRDGAKVALPEGVRAPAGFLKDAPGDLYKVSATYAAAGPARRIRTVGVGKKGTLDSEVLRRAAAVAVKGLEAQGCASGVIHVDAALASEVGERAVGVALAEGATLGAYKFQEAKSRKVAAKLKGLVIHGGGAGVKSGVARGLALGAACAFTRDLQNAAGNMMTPAHLAAEARKLARMGERTTCKVIEEKAMRTMGMGLLLSVSQGSTQPAKLIHLVYKPKGKARGKVALVGKGLTFDAGGISLKPSAKMDDMRYDMSGGAAVLGVFHALSKLDVPVEVHGIVPASENLPDGKATKPGDVFAGMSGTTVEVLNTDAEGRLILADALTYTETKVKPDTIIDLATLTGAVVVGLGHELSGIYPTTTSLRDQLVAAGEATGEWVWPMPLRQVHKDAMKGVFADLKNISAPNVGGGSITAAGFLSRFVGDDTEWCHMDIAGTAWGNANRDWTGGVTGSGVGTRLLMHYLENRS